MLKQVLTKLWEMGKRQEDEGKKESKEEENANVIESDFKEQIEESGDQDTSSSKKKDKNKKTHTIHLDDAQPTCSSSPTEEDFSNLSTSSSSSVSHPDISDQSGSDSTEMPTDMAATEEAHTEMATASSEEGRVHEDVEDTEENCPEEEVKARSDAISLIRARTFTRFSQAESCSPGVSPERSSALGNFPTADSMDLDQTSSEAGSGLSPKKKKKKKSKKKSSATGQEDAADVKGDIERVESTLATQTSQGILKSDVGASAKDGKSTLESPLRPGDKPVVSSDKVSTSHKTPEIAGGEGSIKFWKNFASHSHPPQLVTDDNFPPLPPTSQRAQATSEPSKKSKDAEKQSQGTATKAEQAQSAVSVADTTDSTGKEVDSQSEEEESKQKPKPTDTVSAPDEGTNSPKKFSPKDAAPPTLQSQVSQRKMTQSKERLAPIQEAGETSKEANQDSTTAKRHSPHDSSVSGTLNLESSNLTAKGKGRQSPVTASSHAHPATPRAQIQLTSSRQGSPVKQKPPGFFWQLDSHGFPCAKADCDKRCNLWDGVTVICPRCGPYSEIRYCSKEHLYVDVKSHWVFCSQKTFRHPCRENSIPRDVREGPPLLPSRHNWDTPERHRQAVYHATSRSGDYFIFADWEDFLTAGQPANTVAVRCSNRVICTVKFDDPAEKDRFRRILGASLFASVEVFNLVEFMFRLIRDNLRSRGIWSGELDNALRYQMQQELSVTIDPGIVGQRHACETEWDGRNPRHCKDAICCAEYRPLLSDYGTKRGYRQFCDYLESSYWLLRAARITHPVVTQVAARTRGEGFENVVDDDRRLFRRGEGWDGAGSGEMEIEGPGF